MVSIPENVRKDLATFVPSQLLKEITCFVFYDNHPRNRKKIDITVCTSRGEVKEFCKRDLINSIIIDSCWKPKDIQILRNNRCELFYIVSYEDEIAIISRQEKLNVLHKISNVDTYDVNDCMCRGQASLKIICKDDAVPLFFDNNFEKLTDRTEILCEQNIHDSLPIVTQLARKLIEAKYSVKCNEKVLRELSSLRQLAAYSNLKRCRAIPDGAIFQEDKLESSGPLKIKSQIPWVKICNKKIAIILEVVNNDKMVAENVHILFHSSQPSTIYTTKAFETIPDPPYWKENASNTIYITKNTAIVAIIDLEEIKYNVSSKIDLCGAISYKVGSKELLLPFEEINLSSLDTMSEDFNVLSNTQDDTNKYTLLALLATSEKTELCLRYIKIDNEEHSKLKLLDEFCRNLNMEKLMDISNVAVHKSSPYHILNGVMVIEEKELIAEDKWIISLYTRSQDQILAFIHIMYDAVPYKIVATTTNQQIIPKIPQLCKYDESTSAPSKYIDFSAFQLSMLKQTSMTLEYLDECMLKMNDNKNPAVQNRMGSEIDIFAGGISRFQEFSNNIKEEATRGVHSMFACKGQPEGRHGPGRCQGEKRDGEKKIEKTRGGRLVNYYFKPLS